MAWDLFHKSATFLAVTVAILVMACAGNDDGTTTDSRGDTATALLWDVTSGDGAGPVDTSESGETIPCLTDTPCVDVGDCEAGHRCNHSVSPPSCQRIYCGQEGDACDPAHGDALCAEGLHCIDGDHPSCAAACQPACEDKECGPDGCDGSCGLHDGACARERAAHR